MARKQAPARPPVKIEDEARYRVEVLRPVTAGRMRLLPRHRVVLKGKVIAGLGDAVAVIETA